MNADINEKNTDEKYEQKHLGNLKLSESKKAIKIHIFETNKFYVIPLQEIKKRLVGRIFKYVDGNPEIVGEVLPPKNGDKKPFWSLSIESEVYYLKDTYMQFLLNETPMVLMFYDEKI